MELLHLQYFREIVRDMNMTKTAKRLKISQPALSKTLRNLESELGVPLFDRKGRGIQLNENGRLLYEAADRALNTIDSAVQELMSRGQMENSAVLLADLLPEHAHWFLEQFIRCHPGIPIREVLLNADQEDAIRNGAVDLVLSFYPARTPDCQTEQLLRDELLLLSTPQYMSDAPVDLEAVWSMPVVLHNSGLGIDRDLLSRFEHPAYQVSDMMMVLRLVEQGYGVALMPSYLWMLMQSKARYYVEESRMPQVYPVESGNHGVYLNSSGIRPNTSNITAYISFARDYFQAEQIRLDRFRENGYR